MPPKVTDEAEAERLIVDLMTRDNRPYNAQMVTDHTAGRVRKPLSQKILDRLVEEKHLVAKDFGKNRVYYPDQAKIDVGSSATEEADKVELDGLRAAVAARAAELREVQEEERGLGKTLSDSELKEAVARLEATVAEKQGVIRERQGTTRSAEDIAACQLCAAKIREALAKARKRAARRRREVTLVLSCICEIDGTRPTEVSKRLDLVDTEEL